MNQRVQIQQQGDVTVYSVGIWPGWGDIIAVFVGVLVFSIMLGGIFFAMYTIERIYHEFFTDFLGVGWLHTVFMFLFTGLIDFSIIACLGLALLFMPYLLIYHLSPKKFWIENRTLFHTVWLLGFIPYKRKIPFEQILDVQAKPSNRRHSITVHYERTLPKLLFVILVYWNERLTQWKLTLVSGVPGKEQTQQIQNALLEPMTQSDACRVGN